MAEWEVDERRNTVPKEVWFPMPDVNIQGPLRRTGYTGDCDERNWHSHGPRRQQECVVEYLVSKYTPSLVITITAEKNQKWTLDLIRERD